MNTCMKTIALLFAFQSLGSISYTQEPVWDLKKNGVDTALVQGNVKTEGGTIVLNERSCFGIPVDAIKDPENFTVVMDVKFKDFPLDAKVNLIYKQSARGDGFAVIANNSTHRFSSFDNINGNSLLVSRNMAPADFEKLRKQDHVFQYVLMMKNGIGRHYSDGAPAPRSLTRPLPNKEPMWIGNSKKNLEQIALHH